MAVFLLIFFVLVSGCIQNDSIPQADSINLSSQAGRKKTNETIQKILEDTHKNEGFLAPDLLYLLSLTNNYFPMEWINDSLERGYQRILTDKSELFIAFLKSINESHKYVFEGDICLGIVSGVPYAGVPYEDKIRNLSMDQLKMVPFGCIFTLSFYCREGIINESFLKYAKELNVGGYGTTHSLLALIELKKRGCYNDSALSPLISEEIEVLVNEEYDDTKNEIKNYDLYAERAFVMMSSGHCEKINETWINRIREDLFARAEKLETSSFNRSVGFYHGALLESLSLLKWMSWNESHVCD